jgi:predicted permease
VLGVGALLMLQSFWRLRHENVGFAADGVLSLVVSAPRDEYRGDARVGFYNSLFERVKSIPGVVDAGAIQILPLGGNNWNPRMAVEGRVYPTPDDQPEVDWRTASLDYFKTMRVPLIAGRAFSPADDARAPAVALVNQTLVTGVFGGENPIGRRVNTGFEGPGNWVTIVGVVADTRDQTVAGAARPQFYRPHTQMTINPMALLVRVTDEPMRFSESVQRAIRELEPDVVISDVRPMNEVIGDAVAQPRLLTALLTLFGGLAVLLGAIGIYGVMAYAVGQRKQEMGIRAALGARPSDLLRMVLGEGVRTALAGTVLGVLGALLLSGALEAQLYQVQSLDPLSYGLVALLVLLIALLASLVPARRAGSVRQDALLRES